MNKVQKRVELMWSEGFRALLCMLPMLIASGLGKTSFLVTLGQGGFFYSSLFLPARFRARFIMASLLIGLGLGFYLIGGVVAPNPWLAVGVTFLVSLNLSFLSSWKIGGPLALTLIMIYTAGLNTGGPEKASTNFLVFAVVLSWSAIVSMLPIWKPIEPPAIDETMDDLDYAEQGVRMGIGTSIALAMSYMFDFAKLGWAPSAVGNVVRFNEKTSKLRAKARFIGTLGGALLSVLVLGLFTTTTALVYAGAIFAVLNGVAKKTKLGMMPFFYTATILLLYSANDVASGKENAIQRVFYNLIGITLGLAVIYFPFPYIMKKIRKDEAAA